MCEWRRRAQRLATDRRVNDEDADAIGDWRLMGLEAEAGCRSAFSLCVLFVSFRLSIQASLLVRPMQPCARAQSRVCSAGPPLGKTNHGNGMVFPMTLGIEPSKDFPRPTRSLVAVARCSSLAVAGNTTLGRRSGTSVLDEHWKWSCLNGTLLGNMRQHANVSSTSASGYVPARERGSRAATN